jgi:hypothetical protein
LSGRYAEKNKNLRGNFIFWKRFDVRKIRIQTRSLTISKKFSKERSFLINKMRKKVNNPWYVVQIFLRKLLR